MEDKSSSSPHDPAEHIYIASPLTTTIREKAL